MHDFLFLPRSHKEVGPKYLPDLRVLSVGRCHGLLYEPTVPYTRIESGMVCLSVTCPAFLRLYHNPFQSDSQNYFLCSFLESRSFSLRAFVLHAGSWNSWELGSVVFSVTQWFPIVTLIRQGEEPRVKGIIRERSNVNKSVSNQTSCPICRWRICRKLLGNYNSDLQLILLKP